MANIEKVAGVDSWVVYGDETTYGIAGTADTSFGLVTTFSPSLKNNLKKLRGFVGSTSGGREIAKVMAGKFEGALTLEFTPLLWNWLIHVMGAVSGAGTVASPYVYVTAVAPPSMTISHSIDNDTTDRDELYLGCVVNSVTIKASVGEPVTVSMDILFGGMSKDATVTANVAIPTYEPFTFAGASIEIPNATPIINIIDSVEITLTNTVDIKHGLGSRTGKRPNYKDADYSIKFTVKYIDENLIEKFLGASAGPLNVTPFTPAAAATVAVRFENTTNHFVDFIFANGYIDGFDPKRTLNEMMTEDISYIAKSLTINETKTA